jgi:TolB-like protein/class 3 adenylate cyclase/Flp pilus assembly protein TadD
MPDQVSSDVKLEIGHVLFIDIVGYSKLLITDQSERLQKLKEIVWGTEQFRQAQAEGKLLRLPTGDGGALVFRNHLEAPVLCAMEISEELKRHPELQVRIGIHSGPVNEITDLNAQANIAGAGINIAQRIMDCGDAGHILLSQHVADDLEQYPRWRSHLHDLGECEVKHGARVHAVNLYTDELGNPSVPERFRQIEENKIAPAPVAAAPKQAARFPWHEIVIALLLVAAVMAGAIMFLHRSGQQKNTGPSATASISEKSIAVLPFDNLSSDKENAYFTDGVQDEILTDLAKIADLKVISRTSVMQYKSGLARNLRKIGEELGVAHVVEGSVQRAANKIRVNAQLIDARNDAHLWAQTYDRDLADVFAIQSEIAKAIAGQLQAKILPQEKLAIEQRPTTDLAAYDLYSQASSMIDRSFGSDTPKQDLMESVALLEKATSRDPQFLLAYCKLASAHDILYLLGYDHTPERLTLGEQAIEAAIRLQPDAPEVHLARATHLYSKLDYYGARTELERVQRVRPNDPRALELKSYVDRRQGRWSESVGELERALELDPNNIFMLQQIANSYGALRQFAKAVAAQERILSIKPDSLDDQLGLAQLQFVWKADTKPMHELLDKFIRENPGSRFKVANSRVFLAQAERDPVSGMQALADVREGTFGPDALQTPDSFWAALFARLSGDEAAAQAAFAKARAEQQKVVDHQPDYAPALCVLGIIDAGLGRKDDAIREGRRAAELMPPEKDAINGSTIITRLAMIYAWVGEKDKAIEELERSLRFPGRLSYGQLKLFSQWDPLRGDPRFEKIVASLAPKDAASPTK